MWANLQFPTDLVTFTEEILFVHWKLYKINALLLLYFKVLQNRKEQRKKTKIEKTFLLEHASTLRVSCRGPEAKVTTIT